MTTVTGTAPPEDGAVSATAMTASHPIVAPEQNELVTGTRVSEYVVERKIGEGAMGAVYIAVHPTIGKRVAIKIMNPRLSGQPEAVERFIGEARAVAAIRHPGIVDVFGFGSIADGRLYLVMELLHGGSLRDRMIQGRLGFDEALDVLDQMARALESAHDHGIIHRDLKPENVVLERVAKEPRPIVKILDFGLAKLIDGNEGRIRRTQTGQLLGTPLYMSPEQCRAKNVDHRTDIYALGCMAYELFCGRVPHDADNFAELIAAHLGAPAPMPRSIWPEIPPALDGLLYAMLAKEPQQRPTLAQVREAVATVRSSTFVSSTLPPQVITQWPQSQPGPVALPMSVPGMQPPVKRSRRGVIVAFGAIVVIGVIGAVIAMRSNGEQPAPSAAVPVASSVPVVTSTNVATNTVDAADKPPEPVVAAITEPVTDAATAVQPNVNDVKPDATTTVLHKPVAKPKKPVTGHVETKPDKTKGTVEGALPGTLSVSSKPQCDIFVDDKATGLHTPQRDIKLDAGRHKIKLVNSDFGIADSFVVEIKPGELDNQVKDYSDRLPRSSSPDKTTINPFKKRPSP